MKQQPFKSLPQAQHRYLLTAIFATGAVTLALEIVGTRVISPYYGSSLYCWSALITVTLIALAAGYNLGGRQADRNPSLALFARLTALAGAAVAIVPLARNPVLKMTSPLGVQLGALSSATLLIAPALVLLSALGPLAIRLTTPALQEVGKSAGDIYALSTLGSVAGAVLSGFVLIPHLALSRILYGISCLLLLLAALGSYLSRLRVPLGQLAAAAAVALFGFWPRPEPPTNLRLKRDSAYGEIKVLDFGGRRYLLVNGTTQSLASLETLESESQYAKAMEWAALLRPGTRKALVIGIGAGLLPGAIEKNYGIETDAVEIDPEIAAVAKSYFGFSPRGRVIIEDGRTYLERTPARYGLIYLDAFATEAPPYHLFTLEAFETMKRRLEPGGILAVNIVSIVQGPGNSPWRSAYKTLRGVFPEVRAFLASDTREDLGNVLLFCSNAKLEDQEASRRARKAIRGDLEYLRAHELRPSEESLESAVLMTDDLAPMEFLLAETSARWRAQLQKKVPQILLY